MILRRDSPKARVVTPDHNALRPGTLNQILHAANMTVEELVHLL